MQAGQSVAHSRGIFGATAMILATGGLHNQGMETPQKRLNCNYSI